MARALLLLPLALVLAACGGGGGKKAPEDPIRTAVEKTVEQRSYITAMTERVTFAGQPLTLAGNGGFNHATREGFSELKVTAPGSAGTTVDEVFVKNLAWLKSPSYKGDLPSGKDWIKIDLRDVSGLGFDFKLLAGLNPAYALQQLERTSAVVSTVGEEEIDGVKTTHYRAAIDTKKIPASDTFQKLTKAAYKPIDVWVDEDGRVRQVKLDYTAQVDPSMAERARVRLTMKLTDYGVTVDVEPPETSLVVDATAPVGTG